MNNQLKPASEAKNSSRTSTLAHETGKMSRRVVWLFTAFVLTASMMLTGCGKDDDGDIVGLWTYASLTLDCKNPSNPDLEEQEKGMAAFVSIFLAGTTIEFKSDQTFVITILGNKEKGSWEKSGGHFVIHFPDGEDVVTDGTFTDGSSISISKNVLTIVSNNLDEEYEDGETYRQAGFTKYEVTLVFKK